jgi:protein-S-isoprenylcysteine O-methyltransferase Ste14
MRRGKIFWVLCKTALFTALVPYTAGFWLPTQINRTWGAASNPPGVGAFWEVLLSDFLLCVGAAIYLWCAWDFSVKGLGTPAPIDAPKHLVVNGLYRFVRNPMYVGVFCVIVSRAIFCRSLPIVFYLIFFMVCVNLFVRFYEEPHLRSVFGEQYIDYCRRVSRWLPRAPL